jgi:hypothetical protein
MWLLTPRRRKWFLQSDRGDVFPRPMLDILQLMITQSTVFRRLSAQAAAALLLLAVASLLRVPLRADDRASLDSILAPRISMSASGTLSVQGQMTLSGVPFDALLHADTMVVSTGSPLGMKTSSVYARRDTFVVLNYLTRQAFEGDPNSPAATGMIPIPLGLDDIRCLVRGVPPGDLDGFEFLNARTDGQVLYRRRDTATVEFVLIDTVTRTMRQYQRKRSDGFTVLNVTYGSFKNVDGVMVPFGVSVAANDDQQKIQFRFDDVRLSLPSTPMRPLSVPSSFTRTTLR